MAHGRVGFGLVLFVLFVGNAAAQQPYTTYPDPGGYGSMPYTPGALPPAFQTPAPVAGPPGTPTQTQIQPLAGFAEDHPPMKDLGGLGDIVPHSDHHGGGHGAHGEGHEIDGFMTPFVPHHGGWYVGGEFLLMRPRNSDFDYVVRSITPGLATNGPIESLKYGLGTGVRVEGGYRFGDGKWETVFAYTYFNGNGDATASATPNSILFPTLTRPGLTDRALVATTTADLDYNLFDMMAARRVLVDEHFAVRWLGGFRFTDIKQTFNTLYDGADARRAAVNTRSRFEGFGPIVGAEAVLVGWKGLHLYGRATAGLISGRDSNRLIETNDSGATTYINTQYDVRKVVPMGSIALGGGWQYRSMSIRAGYEITHWQGIFERPRFVDDVSQGKVITRPANLTLEGLFIQVGLSF